MSWAEVKKINNNMKIPLNEQIRNNQWQGSYVFSETSNTTMTFTPDKSGYYKIIVIGAGGKPSSIKRGDYWYYCTGGSGGVAIKNMYLSSATQYKIVFDAGASSASFNTSIVATGGSDGEADGFDNPVGAGGTATGGDFNYPGISGVYGRSYGGIDLKGSSVGVFIAGLMEKDVQYTSYTDSSGDSYSTTAVSGNGILGYGYSSGYSKYSSATATNVGGDAAVIIIPLELEE